MVDLKAVRMELEVARRARLAAETAGFDLERVIERMQAGRTLQQIELEELASLEVAAFEARRRETVGAAPDALAFRHAA
ncbi:MAG: hypothetical protein AB7V13_23425 [Pseudorhodoplanes sp.]|uniref:hypothetical protein n=1 Tax=Pseudorhodoplanes sp. TaxID=1934341 RepID=UPI003D0E51EB